MEKRNKINALIIALAVTVAAVAVLLTVGFAASDKDYKPSGWVLKAYEGNVALYKGDNIETVYGEIVLENLPEDDKKMLISGIAFPTREEAEQAIEDYDG